MSPLTASPVPRVPDRFPRVIGRLLRCGCCCRVRCPFCGHWHQHGLGPNRDRFGWRRADCFGAGRQYELVGVVAGGGR